MQDLVNDLLDGLPHDRAAALGTVRLADASPQQPHMVVDLVDGSDRRAGIAGGGLLVYRYRGRETFDEIDIRLIHLAEELTGIGGERLDVAALPLRVDGIEGKRRLARPGEPRDDDELVPGYLDRDVLQVVLSSAADDDLVSGHASAPSLPGQGAYASASSLSRLIVSS